MTLLDVVLMLIKVVVIFAVVMTLVPVLIYLERKVVAMFQVRVGPNRVGPFGAMQPLADAVKLMMKEDITPAGVDKFVYFLAPLLSIVPALLAAAVIPFGPLHWNRVTDLNHAVLFSFAISSLSVYAVALGGWSSNNKYSLMGAMRSASQMISYELGMGLSIIAVIMATGTMNLKEIVEQQHLQGWNIVHYPPLIIAFVVFTISGIAETNRAPFDLAEAESELVAGFHTEYSSFKFATFFMAEYVNMVVISALTATFFLGGWSGPFINFNPETGVLQGGWPFALLGVVYFIIKIFAFIFLYFWLRATLPRFRYDQLMHFGWKRLLPVSLANLFFMGIWIAATNGWFSGR